MAEISLQNFTEKVNKSRNAKLTDTEILNNLSLNNPDLAVKIGQSRDMYGKQPNMSNDRDLVNFLSVKYGGRMPTTASVPTEEQVSEQEQKPGFIKGVKESIEKRAEGVGEIADVYGAGKQTLAESAVQTVGQTVAGLGDIEVEALKSAGRAVGFKVEPETIQKLLQNPTVQKGLQMAKSGIKQYQGWKKENPRLAANLEAFVNISEVFPIGKVLSIVGKIVAKTGEKAIEIAKKPAEIIQKTKEVVADIDTPTKNVLDPSFKAKEALKKEVSSKKLTQQEAREITEDIKPRQQAQAQFNTQRADYYLSKAVRASKDAAQPTPMELVVKQAEDVILELNKKLNRYGELKQKALTVAEKRQVPGIDNVKLKLLDLMDKRLGVYIDAKHKIVEATGKVSRIALDPSDQNLLSKVYTLLDNLDDVDNLVRVDATVDAIQNLLYKRSQNVFIPINSNTEGILKQIMGELNGLVKKQAGKEYIQANQKYANIVELRDTLNKAIGVEGKKGGALMKRVFSPADTGTKKMFQKIYYITGINLTDEAVLAKFAMEAVGDARQKSLLEEVGLIRGTISGGGAYQTLQHAFETVIKKTVTKEKTGKEILKKASGK